MSILEHFRTLDEFTPTTVAEFIALQLARQAGDLQNLNWHLRLFQKYSIEEVFNAINHARALGSNPASILAHLRAHFHN